MEATPHQNLLQEASVLLRDFYELDARISRLYSKINDDKSDETSAKLRNETNHVEAIIKDMIETAALVEAGV